MPAEHVANTNRPPMDASPGAGSSTNTRMLEDTDVSVALSVPSARNSNRRMMSPSATGSCEPSPACRARNSSRSITVGELPIAFHSTSPSPCTFRIVFVPDAS